MVCSCLNRDALASGGGAERSKTAGHWAQTSDTHPWDAILALQTKSGKNGHGSRSRTEPARHVLKPRSQSKNPPHDLSGERRQAAGGGDLVRQFLRAAATGRTLATRLQARHID